MKLHPIFFFSLLFMLIGCASKKPPITAAKQKTLVICVSDLSKSTKYYEGWDSIALTNLYYSVSNAGGGVIKVFFVKSASMQQRGVSITVPSFDTITYKGNLYQTAKAKTSNAKRKEDFEIAATRSIASLVTQAVLQRNEQYSDIEGCLQLCKQTAEQFNYKEYRIFVIINSDMLLDVPGNKKGSYKQTYQFPENAKVLLVRPSISEKILEQVFGNTPFEIYTSLNDPITTISSQ